MNPLGLVHQVPQILAKTLVSRQLLDIVQLPHELAILGILEQRVEVHAVELANVAQTFGQRSPRPA